MPHWTDESPEYLEATRAAYDELDAASDALRAARESGDSAAIEAAQRRVGAARDQLHAAETAHDSRYQ